MAKQSNFNLDADADYMFQNPQSPERSLLYALLERAVHDLTTIVESHERAAAIGWFRARDREVIHCSFTYDQVIEYLDLSPLLIRAIDRRVYLAECYQQVSDTKTREKIKLEIDRYVKVRGRRRVHQPAHPKTPVIPPEVNFYINLCA